MLLSVLLIYKITHFIGFRLQLKPLLLCAFSAFTINVTALTISNYLTMTHIWLILGLVLVSASFVTYYNEQLLAVPSAGNDAKTTQSVSEYPEFILHKDTAKASLVNCLVEKPAHNKPKYALAVDDIPQTTFPANESGGVAVLPLPELPEPPNLLLVSLIRQVEKAHLKEASAKLHTKNVKSFYPPAKIVPTIAEIVHEDMENDQLLKLTAVLSKLGSLDDILDYAYEQKLRHNYSNSLFAYKQALIKYFDDDYAPFIVIEMGNIYKSIGFYEEAISAYKRAFNLPAVVSNGAIQDKFKKNMDYLYTVKYILRKHNAMKTPFEKIPRPYIREIEFTLQNRRTKKHVS
jgi:colicin import membrane protein